MAVCVCVCVLCHVCVCLCGGIFHPSGGMNAQKRRKKTPRSLLMDITFIIFILSSAFSTQLLINPYKFNTQMFHWFQSIPHPKFSISCLGLARFIIFSFPFLSFLYSHYQVPRFSHSCIRNYYTNTNTLFHHSHTQQNANNDTSSTALTPFLFVAIIHHFCSLMIV